MQQKDYFNTSVEPSKTGGNGAKLSMRVLKVFPVAFYALAATSIHPLPSAEGTMLAISSERRVAASDATMMNGEHTNRVLATSKVIDDDDLETEAPKRKAKKKKKSSVPEHEAYTEDDDDGDEDDVFYQSEKKSKDSKSSVAKKKKKAATSSSPSSDDEVLTNSPAPTPKLKKKKKVNETTSTPTPSVKEKKIGGKKNDGILDGSSEGSAEIDKIDLRNDDGWVSVYDDPPLLVIKASLYAFIAYNDTEVCDTFNMTMNAVEQKEEENGLFSYHVVAYINCTKNGEDETQGRFVLNFIPEGKRLLLTECGHREEGEIVNWLRIEEEVPQCMTPKQRKDFLAQPMKHIHATNGTVDVDAVQTDFLTRLEELDGEEVAIFGSATVALIAVIVVLVVFVMRKRKAQKDLERTIAGAKAEHAVEDDDVQVEADGKAMKERKGLMDSSKAKIDDPDMEEGSFVNSPAVRV
ncbi:hypothetical protein PsorP6_002085 [Peronosclerospora sorghi]|uniref:Uncharacterized protein n=1 Tax=Peronosclerospora sorghi TaxID=230839 RepID=A0ACC0WWP0_9STRA|nr:hypothetical protein PsorP6_002085 [Peronosclerospora sorghi]